METDCTDLFTERLVKVQSDLTSFVFALIPLQADNVQEVVQATNLALIRNRDRYDTSKPFKNWAYAFAKNQVLAFIRDRQREKVLFSSQLVEHLADLLSERWDARGGEDDGTESLLKRLAECRRRLKDPEKLLVALFYEERLPVKEIAEKIGMTPGSVRVTLTRIRRKLGSCLRHLCELDGAPDPADLADAAVSPVFDAIMEGGRIRCEDVEASASGVRSLADDTLVRLADQFRVHALLTGGLVSAATPVLSDAPSAAGGVRPRRSAVRRLAAASAAVFAAAAGLVLWFSGGPRHVATVEKSYCALDGEWHPLADGTRLDAGRWTWRNGIVFLRMRDGTRVIVEAPADMCAISEDHIKLFKGSVVVRMKKGQRDFVVDTPQMCLQDLGTEFGVSVADDGNSSVRVYDGKVLAMSNLKSDEATLIADEAATVTSEGDISKIDKSTVDFIRRLPRGKDIFIYSFNTPRASATEAFRLAGPPVIDGDLSDWPGGSTLSASCDRPYDRNYSIDAKVGFDAENLYVAAKVRDPDPMRNTYTAHSSYPFVGGSVVFRVGDGPSAPEGSATSLVFWYDASVGTPSLSVEKQTAGRDTFSRCPGFENPRTGHWKGAFRLAGDGLGYTMEYAVPWKSLGVEPPACGEIRPSTWNVHFSDNGRIGTGQIVECLAEPGRVRTRHETICCFLDVGTWGTIRFAAQNDIPGEIGAHSRP